MKSLVLITSGRSLRIVDPNDFRDDFKADDVFVAIVDKNSRLSIPIDREDEVRELLERIVDIAERRI